MDILRRFFRRWPRLFKVLSNLYQAFIAPVASGHFQYYVKYSVFLKSREIKKLKTYDFVDIKPFKYREWRIGKGKDNAYRRYYIAQNAGKKCFIKIGKNDMTVKNELDILQNVSDHHFDFLPEYICGDDNFDEKTVMCSIAYINELEKFKIPNDIQEFDRLCSQFCEILDQFDAIGLVHADIHKGNLMLCQHKLILLDFGISMIKARGNKIDYVARPGTFYKCENNIRIYDDAYSFLELLEKQGLREEYKTVDSYKCIKSHLNKNTLTIELK